MLVDQGSGLAGDVASQNRGSSLRGLFRYAAPVRVLKVIFVLSITLFVAVPPVAASTRPAVVASFDVALELSGTYANKVVDTKASCSATLVERATFDASIAAGAVPLKLQSGSESSHRALYAAASGNSFMVTGNGWPENDCTHAPVAIHCEGAVGPEAPAQPSVVAFVQGGRVEFMASLGTAAFQEQPAPGGTCTDSAPFDGGGPTGDYGVGPLLDPYRNDAAITTLAALAKLRKGARLTLVPKHDNLPPGYNVASCDGAADGATIQSCTASVSSFVFKLTLRRAG